MNNENRSIYQWKEHYIPTKHFGYNRVNAKKITRPFDAKCRNQAKRLLPDTIGSHIQHSHTLSSSYIPYIYIAIWIVIWIVSIHCEGTLNFVYTCSLLLHFSKQCAVLWLCHFVIVSIFFFSVGSASYARHLNVECAYMRSYAWHFLHFCLVEKAQMKIERKLNRVKRCSWNWLIK